LRAKESRRLDATNIVTPRVSVITSLSYDHTAVLGNTLAQIAAEKAGIIKPGIPVVSSPQKQEALEVLEKVAAKRGCELTLVGRDVTCTPGTHTLKGQDFSIQQLVSPVFPSQRSAKVNIHYSTFCIPLLGLHQLENATTAYVALKRSGFNLSTAEIAKGFAEVRWPCRFEIASRVEPIVIFDAAHNEDSFRRLAQTLDEYFPGRKVVLIFGVSEDKHIAAMLGAIKDKLDRLIVTRADHPRALEPEKIIETARQVFGVSAQTNAGVELEAATPVEAALERALKIAQNNGSIVLSAGSMFVTAEVKNGYIKRING
jgi:dihydrofolate synthase/folylpolyglutamate synthase